VLFHCENTPPPNFNVIFLQHFIGENSATGNFSGKNFFRKKMRKIFSSTYWPITSERPCMSGRWYPPLFTKLPFPLPHLFRALPCRIRAFYALRLPETFPGNARKMPGFQLPKKSVENVQIAEIPDFTQ